MVAAPVLRIGVSTCLLGEEVRFDGGHKRNRFVVDVLAEHCEWVPVCPEFEMGLGAPRESMRLVEQDGGIRLISQSGIDHTDGMDAFNRAKVEHLATLGLHGYVLKKDSPTCGMERVKIWHRDGGGNERKGVGLFARDLLDRLPLLPIEEEGRLHDLPIRENFIERIFAYYRWTELVASDPRPKDLVAFHTAHKMTLMAHDTGERYRELGRLVADAGAQDIDGLLASYGPLFMEVLRERATPKKHANVLQHLMGYLKAELDGPDKEELLARIDEYRVGLVPLIVPLTLLAHHFRRHPVDWVMQQTYLAPYPAELMLRNHV